MHRLVVFELDGLPEGFATDLTTERFLPRMDHLVPDQTPLQDVRFVAYVTLECLRSSVN